jgi:hypothetical protein
LKDFRQTKQAKWTLFVACGRPGLLRIAAMKTSAAGVQHWADLFNEDQDGNAGHKHPT